MCVCDECGLTGESCCCEEVSRCCSCEFFDHVLGCILDAPKPCIKDQIMSLEIMFDDLTLEAQKEVLELYGLENESDGNFDNSPLFVLECD